MSTINRIILLKEELCLSSKELENGAGLANSSISQWKKGRGKPSLDSIIKLARFFHVSADYLLELSDDRNGERIVPIESSDNNKSSEQITTSQFKPSLSEEEALLIFAFRNVASPDRFRIIQQCMNALDANHIDIDAALARRSSQ